MALYTIGDLHLSVAADKPMDVFGSKWQNHTGKIIQGFSMLGADDVCVICGDVSWASSLEESAADFQFLHALAGEKIILKGNHDYWWSTATKAYGFFEKHGIDSIRILHNNCYFYGDDYAICGTRGWFYEEASGSGHDKKIMNRELGRLETSLKAAGDKTKLVFLHYPPKYADYECAEILELLEKYSVKLCCSGHIHSKGLRRIFEGELRGTRHMTVSADYLSFTPIKIL